MFIQKKKKLWNMKRDLKKLFKNNIEKENSVKLNMMKKEIKIVN